jgi:hypothetical protein
MAKDKKPLKEKKEKVFTRAHAEKALSHGADPEKFTKHVNCHVRRKAWEKMGRPLPESRDGQNKFLVTLQGTPVPKDAAAEEGFYTLLRQRILKEVPVKVESQSDILDTNNHI